MGRILGLSSRTADREEFRQLESVNAKIWGSFSSKAAGASASAVLAVCFLSGRAVAFLCRAVS